MTPDHPTVPLLFRRTLSTLQALNVFMIWAWRSCDSVKNYLFPKHYAPACERTNSALCSCDMAETWKASSTALAHLSRRPCIFQPRRWIKSSCGRNVSMKWNLIFFALLAVMEYRLDWNVINSVENEGNCLQRTSGCNITNYSAITGIVSARADLTTINLGELPGYTGWARPEKTLAGYFVIKSVSNSSPMTGQPITIVIQCRGHQECQEGSSKFYLRAYGPSVIPGTLVKNNSSNTKGIYDIQFVFPDPGIYTVEIVLTFSTSPSLHTFPMKEEWQQPAYEGYLLPEFPLLVPVQQSSVPSLSLKYSEGRNDSLCSFDDLIVSSSAEALGKARWVVTSRSNAPGYTSTTINNAVSKRGYIENVNSIGIKMDYRYLRGCSLLPETALRQQRVFGEGTSCTNSTSDKQLQIIYIGDSVLRVQKDKLRALANRIPNLKFQFLSLHLGYRRNQVMGPSNVESFLHDIQIQRPNDTKVILFNTGLHEIHQLCGADNAADRRNYLNNSQLNSGTFSCLNEYHAVLQDFIATIQQFPADLKIFQTSTAAWPKYGNWGIGWEHNPQGMPLVSDFSETFNEIAFQFLQEKNGRQGSKIHIMDGYWITYARPDNREYGAIGNKLSHPGDEVLSAMSRIWAKMIVDKVC
jgi:hypothetical protein